MGAPVFQLDVKPQEYFREQVNRATSTLKVDIDDQVEFYLVNLLCDFIDISKVNKDLGVTDILGTPIAMMYKNAVEAPPEQSLRLFRRLGDTSLYIAGFFQDFFNRKTFDIGYYISLGSTAYDSVSSILRSVAKREDARSETYLKMSEDFTTLVDVVAEVSADPTQPIDVLAVYDRWNRCKSDRLRRKLEQIGINPVEVKTKLAQ
jgi:hypothetical protein